MRGRPRRGTDVLWMIPVVVAVFLVGLFLGKPTGGATDADAPSGQIAAVRAEEARRDVALIGALTDQARRVVQTLAPVLDGLAATMPVGSSELGAVAPKERVDAWRSTSRAVVAEFAETTSAGTAVNIARSGLAAAARQVDLAVAAYGEALAAPDPVPWLATAARQRDVAVATWSVAATQLDVLNIEAGRGHAHVFLPAHPGQGALTADGVPEGRN